MPPSLSPLFSFGTTTRRRGVTRTIPIGRRILPRLKMSTGYYFLDSRIMVKATGGAFQETMCLQEHRPRLLAMLRSISFARIQCRNRGKGQASMTLPQQTTWQSARLMTSLIKEARSSIRT